MNTNTDPGTIHSGYHALRTGVAVTTEPNLRCIQLTGPDAFNVLDAICPCDAFLLDNQMRHTLLLDENGVPFADIYIGRDSEDAFIVGYGPTALGLISWIADHESGLNYSAIDLGDTYSNVAINGPYAWEFCAEMTSPDIIGLPYLSMIRLEDILVFRAGRTGEYGYHLLVPKGKEASWTEELWEEGKRFDLTAATAEETDQCILENFFFDLYREGSFGLTPLELQLQWRLSNQKENYPGAEAIRNLRETGWNSRVTCFTSQEPSKPDAPVMYEDEVIGKILASGFSPSRGDYVGKALLYRPYWHAGINAYRTKKGPIQTIAAPAIENMSLKVSPYRHSYHTRKEDFS